MSRQKVNCKTRQSEYRSWFSRSSVIPFCLQGSPFSSFSLSLRPKHFLRLVTYIINFGERHKTDTEFQAKTFRSNRIRCCVLCWSALMASRFFPNSNLSSVTDSKHFAHYRHYEFLESAKEWCRSKPGHSGVIFFGLEKLKYHPNDFTILLAVASFRNRFHDSLFPCFATRIWEFGE